MPRSAARSTRFTPRRWRRCIYADAHLPFGLSLPTWLVPSRRLRIALTYRWQLGRWPDLVKPSRFTELVQIRKLHERDRRFVTMGDKIAVKAHVAAVLGDAWVTPTVWSGALVPETPPADLPLIVKASHGCGQIAIVRSDDDWASARRRAQRWAKRVYGRWLDEWAYAQITPRVLIEPLIGEAGALPIDYKFLVVGGRVMGIEVHLDRLTRHRWIMFDRDWTCLSRGHPDRPARPPCLDAMIVGAELLGQPYDCVRVDLYAIDGAPRFGEMTFYPGSGLLPIDQPELDETLGAAWLAAKGRVHA